MDKLITTVMTEEAVNKSEEQTYECIKPEVKNVRMRSGREIKPDLKLITILEIMDMFNISYSDYVEKRHSWERDYLMKKHKY